jgi:pre-rRNA-processing protein TSR3
MVTDCQKDMQTFLPTLIWRHQKENLKKCSLRGLEERSDFRFFLYPNEEPCSLNEDLDGYILLDIEAPVLTQADSDRGLFILDGTWRYAARMAERTKKWKGLIRRSLPAYFKTAYPRRQEDCPDVGRGLSSIEAIYIAYRIFGRECAGLLNNYYWEKVFLERNKFL